MTCIDEAQPTRHASPCGYLESVMAIINQSRIEWMIFDHEKRVLRRMTSKRLYNLINGASYIIEWRMENDLRIRIQLKRKKIIGFIGSQ